MKTKFKNRLFIQVFRVIFLSFIFIFSIFGVYTFIEKKNRLLDNMKNEAQNIAKSIVLASSDALVLNDETFLFEYTFAYLKQNENIENIIVSKKDMSYLIIKSDSWDYTEKLNKELVQLQTKKAIFQFIFSPIINKNVYHYVYPIYLSGLDWGWIHISLNIQTYLEDIMRLYVEYTFLLLFIMVISFISSYFIATQFTKPILLLNQASKDIIKGDLTRKVEILRNDEIGELSTTFNTMVNSLNQSKSELMRVNKNLENRVDKRTSELNLANKKLHELNNSLDIKIKNEIEKRKEQEQILVHQSRLAAMGEMISMIAHQWRQPLNGLGLIVQNIQLQYEFGNLSKEILYDSVLQSNKLIQKMSTTINDFRDFFKPEKKKREVLIYDLISTTYSLLKPSFINHSIDVSIEPSEVKIYTCENELSQVFLNILSNSKDAFIENNIDIRVIQIRVKQSNQKVLIEIDDNAGGIPKKIINKIFEPYFSTKDEKNGTGVGLYMAKVIIEHNMKGKLFPTSLQNGTRFTIELNHE